MACQVGEGIGGVEEVTFLYKLTPGACPKSYGVNVARLAGKNIEFTTTPLPLYSLKQKQSLIILFWFNLHRSSRLRTSESGDKIPRI